MHGFATDRIFRGAACAALVLPLAAGLTACANPQATGAAPVSTATISAGGDCKTMQGQLADMKSKGQGDGPAYRELLDRYLARCFG